MQIRLRNYYSDIQNIELDNQFPKILKEGGGIHIKKKNRGKFTEYCGGKVTDACIRRAKASGNPTLVKRGTFAANARKWKHDFGGTISPFEDTLFTGLDITGGGGDDWDALAKIAQNQYIVNGKLVNRGLNKQTFDKMYNYARTHKIPYNTVIGMMGSVLLESGGFEDARQIDWNYNKRTKKWRYLPNGGYGLIQWTGVQAPKNQIEAMFNDIINPYHPTTNYWRGENTYRQNLLRGVYNPVDSAYYYRRARVRPGVFGQDKLNKIIPILSRIYKKY